MDGAHTLPSGRAAELCDISAGNSAIHLGDLAGGADGGAGSAGAGVENAHMDHDWVCGEIALPAVGICRPRPPARIVVQLMAEPFIRGEPAPGITQSIEAYTLRDGACIWELL
jgi:hypothetical protein